MKKLLVISQVIPQWYVDILSKALANKYDIVFLTGSNVKSACIVKAPSYNSSSVKMRLKSWLSFFFFVKRWKRKNRKQKYDCILAISNPPINSKLGLELKNVFKAKLFYMNWDLYPNLIQNRFKNKLIRLLCWFWEKWNNKNYPKIDRILTIGDIMAETIQNSLTTKIPIQVIKVAVDTDYIKPIPKSSNPFCIANGLTDKFVVLYSGKMGIEHNIETILECAHLMSSINDICFVFIGDGEKKDLVLSEIQKGANNIKYFPLQEEKMFPYSIASGDIGLVSQDIKSANLFMPSKTYSMMAAGEAIVAICSDRDDLSSLVKSLNIGEVVISNSANDLMSIIMKFFYNPVLLDFCKKNSRIAAENQFGFETIKKEYELLFDSV